MDLFDLQNWLIYEFNPNKRQVSSVFVILVFVAV